MHLKQSSVAISLINRALSLFLAFVAGVASITVLLGAAVALSSSAPVPVLCTCPSTAIAAI